MIKSKFNQVLTAVALAVGAVGSANAFVITAGNFKITLDNYDVGNVGYAATTGTPCFKNAAACDLASPGSLAGGVDTAGIFSVALITNSSTGAALFTKGTDGYLTGVFGGLKDQTVDTYCSPVTGVCSTSTWSVGGSLSLFLNATDWNPALTPTGAGVNLNAGIYPGITSGSLFLSADFAAGAVTTGDTTSTYRSSYSNADYAGNGQGFLDVTGGSVASLFNTNSLIDANGKKRDMFLTVTYDDVNGAASGLGWTVISAGQVKGQANSVPEPGAMALIALALMGAGAATRRKS